jgi:hypothetical protein
MILLQKDRWSNNQGDLVWASYTGEVNNGGFALASARNKQEITPIKKSSGSIGLPWTRGEGRRCEVIHQDVLVTRSAPCDAFRCIESSGSIKTRLLEKRHVDKPDEVCFYLQAWES